MEAVQRSREFVAQALTDGDLGREAAQSVWPEGGVPTLRWILVHMIEETARHAGHADLMREVTDGRTGE